MDILVSVNSKMYILLLTLLYSVFQNNPDKKINVWLCYSDLQDKELCMIEKFVDKSGGVLNKLYINEELYRDLNVEHYPKEVYFRVLAIDLLPVSLDKILYMDVDMIVKGSLEELYNTDISEYAFAASNDIYGELSVTADMQITGNDLKKESLNIPYEYNYINSGLILFNLNYFRDNSCTKRIIHYMQHEMTDYRFPEQDALNAVLYSKIKYVPWYYYNCPPLPYLYRTENGEKRLMNFVEINELGEYNTDDAMDIYKKAIIIHFSGSRKPWISEPGNPEIVIMYSECFSQALDGIDQFFAEAK